MCLIFNYDEMRTAFSEEELNKWIKCSVAYYVMLSCNIISQCSPSLCKSTPSNTGPNFNENRHIAHCQIIMKFYFL